MRDVQTVDLPPDLLAELKRSADIYHSKKKKDDEDIAKKSAKKVAKEIQYPMLSKLVGNDVDISLKNESVRKLAKSMLSELFQLYNTNDETISVDTGHGKEISLVQISRSVNAHQYEVNDSKNGWVKNIVNASIGGDTSQREGIDCLRNRLDILSMNDVPAGKDITNSDGPDEESDNMSIDPVDEESDDPMAASVLEALDFEAVFEKPTAKRRKREDQRDDAARMLAPRFKQDDSLEWKDSGVKLSNMTACNDTKRFVTYGTCYLSR